MSEDKEAQIRGLRTELAGYEFRLSQAETDEDKAAQRENIRAVKASLKAFGAEGKPPSQRAEKLSEPKPKDVYPELKDKAWVKGEEESVEKMEEAVEEGSSQTVPAAVETAANLRASGKAPTTKGKK